MGLSCSCGEWDGESGWCFYGPDDFVQLKTKRRRRCSSCTVLIDLGAECLEFSRERAPLSTVEMNIYGDTVPMSSLWMCSDCGEIYLNLTAAGYCLTPGEDMRECLREYHQRTGFKHGEPLQNMQQLPM